MKLFGMIALAIALVGAAPPPSSGADAPQPEPTSTQRHVHGVITAVSATGITIATEKGSVTGKIDSERTKITFKGKPAKPSELPPSVHAKAELCLDDVWLTVDAHEVH
jgi:hypothetical protein